MSHKIVIVEDDVSLAEIYKMKFELEGYQVETAADGQKGLEVITEFKPEIVLLDILMPNMSGTEMLKRLRKQPGGKDVKVVMLSNIYDLTTTNEVYRYSPEEYLVKAIVTPQEVFEHIEKILANKA